MMEVKELIDNLKYCQDPKSDCSDCQRWTYECESTCVDDLLSKAATALETQQKRIDELEIELRDERHRHDRLQDFEVSEAKELEFQKNATIRLRKQWQEAECLICTMCGHCEYEIHGDTLCMQLDCGEVVGYPCCGKFIPRNRWIPVTERLPKEHESAIPALGTVSNAVLVTFWDRTSDKPFPQNCFVRESYTRNGQFFNKSYNGDLTAIAWKEMPLPFDHKEGKA